jgi:hypothetical protein
MPTPSLGAWNSASRPVLIALNLLPNLTLLLLFRRGRTTSWSPQASPVASVRAAVDIQGLSRHERGRLKV